MTTRTNTPKHAVVAIIALAAVASAMSGCRGDRSDKPPRQFFPDMDDSPKFKPQAQSGFFTDGRTMRPTVAGTVAFGRTVSPSDPTRADYLRADDEFYQGMNAKGEYLARIPASVKVDDALLKRGQERFNIYCAACHNYDGHGKGMVGQNWTYDLPNFHDAKYQMGATEEVEDPATKVKWIRVAKTGLDGYIFHTIRHGVENGAKMPGYGHALKAADAWAVVAYFRALQTAENGRVTADVPPAEQARVQSMVDQARLKWERDEAQRKAAAAAEAEAAAKAAAEKSKTPAPASAPEKKP